MLSTRIWRAFLRKLFLPPKKRLKSRLRFEQLEDRVVPATVTWINSGSGNWDVGSNWSTGSVPGSGDTAVIDTTGTATITIKSGDSIKVQSVTTGSNDTLSITGGSLTVTTGTSTLSGALSMTGGSLIANGSSATFTADANTSVSEASLFAEGGAELTLPNLTSYVSSGTFEATGTNSVLDVSALTSFTQQNGWNIDSYNGGTINLSGLSGTLTSTKGINFNDTGGSTILAPNLTSLSGVDVQLDGTDQQVISTWTSFENGILEIEGGTYNLPGLTDVDESTLEAENGSNLTLPNLTSYVAAGTFEATGTNSVLNVSALTSYTQQNGWNIDSYHGGTINLSGLSGTLTSTKGINFNDTGGSTILAPNLTSLNGVDVQLDGTDQQVVSTWTSFLNGIMQIEGGSYTLSGLTDVDESSLQAENGGQLTLPNLTSYVTAGTFEATGTGSLLDVSALTSYTQQNGWNIDAYQGGTINLSGLSGTLTSTKGINFNDTGGSTILAPNITALSGVDVQLDGTDQQVVSTWTSYVSGSMQIEGGTYNLPGLTDINESNIEAENGGQLTLPNLTSYVSAGTFQATGANSLLDFSALTSYTQQSGWNIDAYNGGTVNISGLTSLISTNGISLNDTGSSTIIDPNLTALNGVNVQLDGTDPNVTDSWTTFLNGNLTVSGGTNSFPALTDADLTVGNGATLDLPVLTMGNVKLDNGAQINLQGTLVNFPSTGTSGASINVPQAQGLTITLDNTGTLTGTTFNVGQGANVVLSGGTYLGTTTFNIAQNATVDLTGGQTTTYGGTLTGSGAGTVQLSSGTFYPATGGVTLDFAGGMFQWTGGSMELSVGNVTNDGTINLSGSNQTQIYADGTLYDYGAIVQTGSGDFGLHSDNNGPTTLMIESGGQYLMESNAGINNLDNTNAIDNAGTIRKTAGGGTSTIQVDGSINNTGTIEADADTLYLDAGSITQISGSSLTAGTWNALDGATLKFPSGTNITSNSANLSLNGNGATISGISDLASNSGSFTVGSGATVTTAGSFSNSGTLTLGGTLNVDGSFTQTSGAVLNEQIGGTPASGQFGQLNATSGATLAGAFELALINGFAPLAGEAFAVLTFGQVNGSFTTISGLGSYFTDSLTATAFNLENASTNPVDLASTSVTAPTSATLGQRITVNWQVTNQSTQNATGSWQDSVYLSTTPSITSSSTLLGSVPYSNGLGAGDSYSASLTATLPAVFPGNYYILVVADSLYQESDLNRANNTLAATTGQVQITAPAITLGSPLSGSFTAAGQDQYYQVTVPTGGSLSISLASAADSGATALYVSQGTVPTPFNSQYAATVANQPNQTITVPQVLTAGTYYILAQSVSGAAATAGFTLTVTQTSDLTISGSSSYPGGNGGNATIEIDGTNFTPSTTASLTLGTTTINSSTIEYVSASKLYATFNLSGATVGNYTLGIQQGTQSATAPSLFQVVSANSGSLNINLSVPQYVRSGRTGIIVVTYTNESNNDITAPLLNIASTNNNVLFSTPDNPNNYVSSEQVLAVAPTGPAGILLPGQSGQLTLTILSNDTTDNDTISVKVSQIETGQTIDWASQKSLLQPSYIPTAAWNVIWTNLMTAVGTTTNTYNAALAQAATYLSGLGESAARVSNVANLWSFLVSQADAEFPTSTLTPTIDASLPIPGNLSLSIDRTFTSNLSGRYTQGMFGLGWVTPWQTSVSVDSTGNVTLDSGSSLTYFALQANGSYLDTAGEYGTLTQSGGVYTFTSTSGIQYVFLANGLLNYEQDTNNNRITLGYNVQNQIVSLTYSNTADSAEPTEELTLTYNDQGFVSQVADGTGDVWTYTYDSDGHLTSVTAPGNLTTSYTYNTGSNAELTNALLSISNPDGSQQNFTYNSTTGQLTGTSTNGGANPITYSYLGEGEVQATDAAGNQTTVWYNEFGLPGMVENALGGVSTYQYDSNGNLIDYTDPAGDTYQYTYNSNGNLTTTTNPLGQTTTLVYGSLDNLTSMTDADGNTTLYSYDSAGNLLSIAYPDGTSQSFTYNPLGSMTETIEQNGDPVNYQYNSNGLVTEESFADGTSETFTYDAHGNVLTAETFDSDGNLTGTTTLTYNAANELLSINYPNGQYLDFTYNSAGQRIQSINQSGFTVNYSYNSLGQLTELSDGSGDLIVQYTYNNLNQLVEKQNGNGTYTTYAYDAAGNLTNEVNYANSSGTTINSSFTYTYDVLDEMTSMTDASGNTTTYSYDATGQLTGISLPNGGGTISYVYNAAGDRTEAIDNGTTTTYTSNSDNEITSVGSATYAYDANGDLASVTDSSGTTTYVYNDLNQLESIAAPDGTTTTFQYSPLGYLVGENIGGTQTNYLVDPTGSGNVVSSYTGNGSLIANYTYGLGLVSTTGPSGTGYYDFNGSGNSVGITGSSGTYVNQYSYLPFGETTTISATLPNPFTFAGQSGALQVSSNLFSMQSGDYTPATGQFLSNNPTVLNGGGINDRSLAGNNPLSFINPTGMNVQVPPNSNEPFYTAATSVLFARAPLTNLAGDSDFNLINIANSIPTHSITQPTTLNLNASADVTPLLSTTEASSAGSGIGIEASTDPGLLFYFSPGLKQLDLPSWADIAEVSGNIVNKKSTDPNVLIGPAGYGTPGYIADSGALPYAIDFENDGSTAAEDVTITEQLDSNLDWSTFQLGSFGFGQINITVPAGLTQYQTTISYQNSDGTPLDVLVSLSFNVSTGLLTATFTSIDPTTGQTPTGVFDGFLYPDNSSGVGEGYIQYTIQPESGLANGTTINQQGAVVFDTNSAIDTETVTNTIDSTPPTSSVNALPSNTTTPFAVSWSGSDPNGPGIASYTIYVSVNGGSFTPWLTDTTATSATYNGTIGDTYSFYSVATDNVGLVQSTPSGGQATTTVIAPTGSTVSLSSSSVESNSSITVTLQAIDSSGNDITTGGLTVLFSLTSVSGGQGTFSSVTDNGNGTYTATFTGTIAGSNSITATVDGQEITTSPASISITPGPVDLAKSVVSLSSGSIQSGDTSTVTLQAEDADGNDLTTGGLAVAFALGSNSGGQGTFSSVIDNGNGTYTATFTGTIAGNNTITATIGGQAVTSTVPSITVTPGPVSLAKSIVNLSSGNIEIGDTSTITLQAKDANGNDLTTGGLMVEVALGSDSGGQGTFSAVTDNGNGTYTATFTGTVAGSNTIIATIDAQAVTSAAPSITIASQVSLANSIVTVSPGSVESGSETTVTLQAKDANGNDLTTGGLTVTFALGNAGGGQGTFSAVTDNNNGTYTATFTGTIAGNNTITATIDGQAVTSTPPSITVTPGPVSLSNSLVTLSASSIQLDGVTTITLQARDAEGNDETSGGLSVAFALSSTAGAKGTFSSVTDNHNGTYTATFTGTTDGSNTITATINSSPVTSTESISVTGAAFSTAKSTLKLSSSTVESGSTTTVTLQVEDAKGNKETAGGLSVAFKLASAAGGQGTFGSVTDNGNGIYTATFTGTIAGSNAIVATIDGLKVTSPAPVIKVTPGSVSLAKSFLKLSSTSVKAGNKVIATLQPEDAAGNKVIERGLVIEFALGSVSGGQGTFSAATYNANGTYTAVFTGTTAGSNTITATINGQPVTTSAPAITVTPGAVSLAKSVVSVLSGSVQAGTTTTVTLQAIDAYGNKETSGGLSVAFLLESISGGRGIFSAAKDNKNGTYTAILTGTIAGNNAITAMLDGYKVTSTAPTITVTPGAVNLAKSVVSVSSTSVPSGSSFTVMLQAKDAYGNKETTGGLTIAFALASGKGGQGTFSSVTDNGNGTYTATFTGTIAGLNAIVATIGSAKVTSTAPTIKVTPGPVSPATSLVALAVDSIKIGGVTRVTLQAKDAAGNNETTGGLTVHFLLANSTGGLGTFGPVTDNRNGTYTVVFKGTAAGDNAITAEIDGQPIISAAAEIAIS